jgi:hypothetical protein
MSSGKHSFKQLDLERTIRAAQKLGLTISRIVMQKDGLPAIEFGVSGKDMATVGRSRGSMLKSWDKLIQGHEGQDNVAAETPVRAGVRR